MWYENKNKNFVKLLYKIILYGISFIKKSIFMQSKIRLIAAVTFIMAAAFTSCKKTDTNQSASDQTTELTAQADDQSSVSTELDAVANDANTILESNVAFNGKIENALGVLCNATTVADSANGIKKITITYNGSNCSGKRSFTGVVVLSMPVAVHWKDAGAVLTINIQNLKITRVNDSKSITINGTKTITNVTGGILKDLSSRGTITHAINGTDLSLTFDNGTKRTWQVAKQRVFTFNNGIVITTTGTHKEGAVSGISEWGTNRFGNDFVTAISQPMVVRQDCDFRLVSGEVTHGKLIADVTVTFGLNAAGETTGCPNDGTYYFKAVWKGINGVTKTTILPY
jgi:hypothetical protein